MNVCVGDCQYAVTSRAEITICGLNVRMALMAEGLGFHVPKGYIYFAMAFSIAVEILNLKLRSRMGLQTGIVRPLIREF